MKNLFQSAPISNEPTENKQTVQNPSKLRQIGVFAITGVVLSALIYAGASMAFFNGKTPDQIQNEIDSRVIEFKTELRDMEIERLEARKEYSQSRIKDLKKQIDPDTEKDFTEVLAEIQIMNDHIQIANDKIKNLDSGLSFFEITLSEGSLGNENATE